MSEQKLWFVTISGFVASYGDTDPQETGNAAWMLENEMMAINIESSLVGIREGNTMTPVWSVETPLAEEPTTNGSSFPIPEFGGHPLAEWNDFTNADEETQTSEKQVTVKKSQVRRRCNVCRTLYYQMKSNHVYCSAECRQKNTNAKAREAYHAK